MGKFTAKEISDIGLHTHWNAHTEARLLIAKKIKSNKEQIYRDILARQHKQGSLSWDDSDLRFKTDAMLWKELKKKVSKREYDAIMKGL